MMGVPEHRCRQEAKVTTGGHTDLLQVLHLEGELFHVSLVALFPGLLLLATGVPAQTFDDIMLHWRSAIVFGRLPAQSHGVLRHQIDLQLGGGVRWV